ncbi:MAG: class B sortase [Eubacterium sp.]|nr:class B sortase [Eubacterium sp.]
MSVQKPSGGRRVIQIIDGAVNTALLMIFVILLALGAYGLWDSNQVYVKALESYTQYKPDHKDNLSFEELKAINGDVFGWLTIYGTHMDYPLVQGKNNQQYINTSAKGEFALSGAIFLDYRNAKDFSDFNSIIFGHHMDKNAMFGDLTKYNDQAWFDSHLTGNLYYDGADHGLEIFAFLTADAYDTNLYSPGLVLAYDQNMYLRHIKELAVHYRDIDVDNDDRIVLLSTCTDATTNGRELLAAKITDETFENPYAAQDAENQQAGVLDALRNWFARFNGWWLLLPAVMILPAAILRLKRLAAQRKREKR